MVLDSSNYAAPPITYEQFLTAGKKPRNLWHDTEWTPVTLHDTNPTLSPGDLQTGEIAVCSANNIEATLFALGSRLTAYAHRLRLLPEFRRALDQRWFQGSLATGTIPQLLANCVRKILHRDTFAAVMFYISNRWECCVRNEDQPALNQSRPLRTIETTKPRKAQLHTELPIAFQPQSLEFAVPRGSSKTKLIQFERKRGIVGDKSYSHEFTISNNDTHAPFTGDIPCLRDCFQASETPGLRGWLNTVMLEMFLFRKSPHTNPTVTVISMGLQREAAVVTDLSLVYKSYNGIYSQYPGLEPALLRWYKSTQRGEHHVC
jgi:hypothetical protein